MTHACQKRALSKVGNFGPFLRCHQLGGPVLDELFQVVAVLPELFVRPFALGHICRKGFDIQWLPGITTHDAHARR